MSTLREALEEYLQLRRDLGFKLTEAGRMLPRFVTFLEEHGYTYISTRLAVEWAQHSISDKTIEWGDRLSYIRGFARYRFASDVRTEIPPRGLMPCRSVRATPYLYTDEEIVRLMNAALNLPTNRHSTPMRPWVFYCLFGLLSSTGMRYSEALDLHLADLDLEQALLTVRNPKMGRTRLIPLHTSTVTAMASYLRRREDIFLVRQYLHMFSSPGQVTDWIRGMYTVPFTHCRVRLAYAVSIQVTVPGYTIFATVSRYALSLSGTRPAKMFFDCYRCCRLTSVMSGCRIPTGT